MINNYKRKHKYIINNKKLVNHLDIHALCNTQSLTAPKLLLTNSNSTHTTLQHFTASVHFFQKNTSLESTPHYPAATHNTSDNPKISHCPLSTPHYSRNTLLHPALHCNRSTTSAKLASAVGSRLLNVDVSPLHLGEGIRVHELLYDQVWGLGMCTSANADRYDHWFEHVYEC